MGNLQVNNNSVTENVMTQMLNEMDTKCSAKCSVNQSNDAIIINGGTVNAGGGIGFQASCSVSASCLMDNQLNSQAQSILASISQQANAAATDLFGDFSFNAGINNNSATENITNIITNVTNSTCNSEALFNQSNDLFYASDATLNTNGFVGFQVGPGNSNSVSSSCTMTNISKMIAYNQEQADNTQKNTSLGIFVIIIVVLGIVFVVSIIVGGIVLIAKPSNKDSSIDAAALLALEKSGALDLNGPTP